MPRARRAFARDIERSNADDRCLRDQHRLRTIDRDFRWKIIRLSATESRRPRIDRRRRCRKSGGESASREAFNDEARMTNDELIPKPELQELHSSSFGFVSGFVIRISSFRL